MAVELSPRAVRDLRNIGRETAKAVAEHLRALDEGKPNLDVKALHGVGGGYLRLRIGDHRVIYRQEGATLRVVRIVDRKELERAVATLAKNG